MACKPCRVPPCSPCDPASAVPGVAGAAPAARVLLSASVMDLTKTSWRRPVLPGRTPPRRCYTSAPMRLTISTFMMMALATSGCMIDEEEEPALGDVEQDGTFNQGTFNQGTFNQGTFNQGTFNQ